jgi:hypothetical protein
MNNELKLFLSIIIENNNSALFDQLRSIYANAINEAYDYHYNASHGFAEPAERHYSFDDFSTIVLKVDSLYKKSIIHLNPESELYRKITELYNYFDK